MGWRRKGREYFKFVVFGLTFRWGRGGRGRGAKSRKLIYCSPSKAAVMVYKEILMHPT